MRAPREIVLARWVHRATRADQLAFALPRALALGLLLVEADAMVDWKATASLLQAQPAWSRGWRWGW